MTPRLNLFTDLTSRVNPAPARVDLDGQHLSNESLHAFAFYSTFFLYSVNGLIILTILALLSKILLVGIELNPGPRSRKSEQMVARPRQLSINTRFKMTLRYAGGNSSYVSITRAMMLNTYLMNLTSSTSNARILQAIKLNRIEIFGAGASGVASTGFCAIQWLSTLGPAIELIDTSNSTAYPPHLITSPPPNTLASFWSIAGSNESEVLFKIYCVTNSVVDISFEAVFADGANLLGAFITSANSGSSNYLYVSYLDGPNATGVYPAMGVATLN
jgi:hypothetical protein